MTTIDFSVTSARPSLFATIVALASDIVRATRNRRAFYKLGEMSEAELHDIGLTRADLSVPVEFPLSYDPTAQLNRAARSRINGMQTWGAYRA